MGVDEDANMPNMFYKATIKKGNHMRALSVRGRLKMLLHTPPASTQKPPFPAMIDGCVCVCGVVKKQITIF